jgi:hypothetical protein
MSAHIRPRPLHRLALGLLAALTLIILPTMAQAATFTVTVLADESNGNVAADDLSLREAMAQVALSGVDGAIDFDPALFSSGAKTITLNAGLGRLPATAAAAIEIEGPGANLLSLSGGGATGIFRVDSGGDLTFSGMTLQNAGGGSSGHLIIATGDLTVTESVLKNSSSDSSGGAIYGAGTTNRVVVRSTTISETQTDNAGAGIYMGNGTLVLDSVMIFGCEAGSVGGAVAINAGTLLAANTTFSTNQCKEAGGGLYVGGGSTTLVNCTIVENMGGQDGNVGGRAGGVANAGGTVVINNTLVAGNTGLPAGSMLADSSPDATGAFTANASNLIGVGGSATGFGAQDIVLDTDLPLFSAGNVYKEVGNNGGPTRSHQLVPGSPAINAGDNALAVDPDTTDPLTTDQRGTGFPRIFGETVDIGAIDARPNVEDLNVSLAQAPGQSDPTNALPITFSITFSEPCVGFDQTDIIFGGTANVSAASLTQTAPAAYTLTIDGVDNDGTVIVSVPFGAATDRFDRPFQSSEGDGSVTYDTTRPAVALTSTAPALVNGPFTVTATFDDAVFGFTTTGLALVNATAALASGVDGGMVYTLTITPIADGPVSVSINADAATDLAGNSNTASPETIERTFDGTPPGVTLVSAAADVTNTAPVPVTITFDEPVFGFSLAGLGLMNADAAITSGADGDSVYELALTPAAEGALSVTINSNAAQDAAGNGNTASDTLARTYDITAAMPIISTSATNPTGASPIAVTVDFGEPVQGFELGDLSAANATLDNFSGTGATYMIEAIPDGDGIVTVSIPANAAADLAGNMSLAADPLQIVYDTGAPFVDQLARRSSSPTTAASVSFDLVFSEPVLGVDNLDFQVQDPGNTLPDAAIANVTGMGTTYVVTVNTGTGEGTLGVIVLATEGIVDTADRPLEGPFTAGETYEVDTRAPTVVLSTTAPDPTYAGTLPVTATFSESVTGFEAGDLVIENGTATDFLGSDDVYTFTVVPDATGEVSVEIPADAAMDALGNLSEASNVLTRVVVDPSGFPNPVHTGDQNGDFTIDFRELLRVIQLYNASALQCAMGTEDGYAPGAGDESCPPHDADYNPQDWAIGLEELLRVIQFFRYGAVPCPDASEDDFCAITAAAQNLPGDADGNGRITHEDAEAIYIYLTNLGVSLNRPDLADYNGDTLINDADLQAIVDIVGAENIAQEILDYLNQQ